MNKLFKDEESRKLFRVLFWAGAGIVLFSFILSRSNLILSIVSKFFSIISPFIGGALLAWILLKVSENIESILPEKMKFRTKRFLSSLLSVLSVVLVVILLVVILIPQLAVSVSQLSVTIQSFTTNANAWLNMVTKQFNLSENFSSLLYRYSSDIINAIWTFVQSYIPNIIDVTKNMVSAVGNIFIAVIVALYVLIDRDGLATQFKRLFKVILKPNMYEDTTKIITLAEDKFEKFISGKIVDSVIIGFLCFIAMSILKLDFAPLISVVVGVTNIIPFFGPFIGAIPSALILLIVSPTQSLIFIVMILVLQQIDGNIIGPKILGDSVGLSSIWIMFAIVVGGGYFGFYGMLLGVPVFAIIYFLIKEYVDSKLEDREKKEG